ncbi:MAG: SDR family oxidoreductase [Bacteroidales bacterium]|nr:SDR family oxidoreductase [Candidatus Colimorpha onthohippi]
MKKVIIITGASSGFGKATAELLANKGHVVYGLCRRPMQHPSIRYMQADIRDSIGVQSVVETIYNREHRIDVLINNAGMGIGGSLELASQEEIKIQMDTNFMGCVNMCQSTLRYMRQQRYGKIINLSSIGGVMGLPYQGFYSASKFAIEGFSEALSAEVKRFGISVSMVEPGDFATNFTASRKNSEATLNDPDYGPVFKKSLSLIEKEENGGLKPDVLAKKIAKIVECKHPKLRYVVANLEQRMSVILKKIIPGNWYVDVLRSYYKS